MTEITPASSGSIQGIIKWFKFTTVTDGDTFVGPGGGTYWAQQTSNPSTQAAAGVSVARSGTTYTLYPGEDELACTLFVQNIS